MIFKLHSNKNITVQNTASASLRQICVMIFEKAHNEFKATSASSSASNPQSQPELIYSKDAFNLILVNHQLNITKNFIILFTIDYQ